MRLIYSTVLYLLVPFVIVRLLLRSRKAPDYSQRWGERFGFCLKLARKRYIWIHSVSVGETVAAAPMVRQIMDHHPDVPILITTMTPTGSAQVKKLFGDRVDHVYIPYDLPCAVKRFLNRVQPRLAVIMETELWPNLFHHCRKKNIPVIVANARLSERSANGYQRFAKLTAQTLANIDVLAAQGESDAERFKALGMIPERIHITGSIKFDTKLSAGLKERGEELRRSTWGRERVVWIAASTREGEEEQILDAFDKIKPHQHETLLVLVPRHPERFNKVAELCKGRGHKVVRRSEGKHCTDETDIFLGDTMGELGLFYAASDVCYMGGSLVPTGGHNILEPAALGLPIVFGPHMYNFDAISKLFLERHAAIQVDNCGQLVPVIKRWLSDANARDEVGQRALQLLNENRGALEKLLTLVEEKL